MRCGIESDLLHSETVPWTSRERLKDFSLIVCKACIETFGACGKPAFGDEAFAFCEVVGRTVGGKMRDADPNLFNSRVSLIGE
jgi:hypothetical protein